MTKKRSEEDIIKLLKKFHYELLEYYKRGHNFYVIIKDEDGYMYNTSLSSVLSGRATRFVDNKNPYSIQNIKIWLIKNEIKFELYGNNTYKGSKKKLSFKCFVCNEVFSKKWNSVFSREGCPYCDGKKVGETNSLLSLNPFFLNEWDYSKNKITPSDVTIGSNKKAWWICRDCSYGWISTIKSRKKTSCPACAGKVATENNSLSSLYPDLSLEWNYEKNKTLSPDTITYGSKKMVWWKCSTCNFEWINTPNKRTYRKDGCPKCSSSIGEKTVREYLNNKNIFFYSEYRFKDCVNEIALPFDFYIPSMNICIEYDGIFHYEDIFKKPDSFKLGKKRDRIKNKYCKKNKIKLLRIPYWDFEKIEKILDKNLFYIE